MVTIVKHIRFELARWQMPDGTTFTEAVPKEYKGHHFGPDLRKYIIYQTHHNRVPQKKIHDELLDKGIQISTGQIDAILNDATVEFTKEYDDILASGLLTSKHVHVDDTGARHQGKTGHTTVLCNDAFTYLKSTDSKSRVNLLKILSMQDKPVYTINQAAFDYAEKYGLVDGTLRWFKTCEYRSYTEKEFEDFLNEILLREYSKIVLREACLYATCLDNGLSPDLIILSDGARQFSIMVHALCWVHAVRAIKKLVPVNNKEAAEINRIQDLIWNYYRELLDYQKNPMPEKKIYLSEKFDSIFSTPTIGCQLAPALKSFLNHKNELLLMLEHPHVPLHNNLAERDLRHTVIKRKISGGTRGVIGRKSRDVFVSLFKTCVKNGISIWNYLGDRISGSPVISNLGAIIRARNAAPVRAPSI